MEIYYKDKEGKLQETTLLNLLTKSFKQSGFKLNNGAWPKEDHYWLGVVQKSHDKQPKEITTNITFKNNGNTISGVNVYISPIVTIVDNDNMEQLI